MKMIPVFFGLMVLANTGQGANLDAPTAKLIQIVAPQIRDKANDLLAYANFAGEALTSGLQVEVPFTGDKLSIPLATQNKLLDVTKYKATKAEIQALLDQLP